MHTYKEVINECSKLKKKGVDVEEIGTSRHGNKILMASVGEGDKRALIVCRQHGNEPTSTEAMLEYIKEIQNPATKEHHRIKEKTKLCVIPIANPDGAKIFEYLCRKNKTSLLTSYAARSNRLYRGDINRDHKKRKTTEAQAIYSTVKRVQPHLIIDLHNFYPAYRYFILQKTFHDFCPALSTHPKIKPEIQKTCYKLCKIAINAVRNAGGKPAKINGLWPGVNGRMLTVNEGVLETYYSLYHDTPSLTLEALGGFNLCSRRIGWGKKLHKAAVHAILESLL
ncbi:MAG: M14 family zinc carboxypeptidase [Candidatus Bathyarchaeales archaeon]